MRRKVVLRCAMLLLPAAVGLLDRGEAAGQNFLYARLGNASFSDDPFCLESTAFFTSITVGYDSPLFGVSVERINNDWPWPDDPPDPPGGDEIFLTNGSAFQVMAHVNPVVFVNRRVNDYVRPFVGVGLHIATDGEAETTAAGDVFGVRGQTRPFIAYGLNGYVPFGRVGLTATYRRNTIFFNDFELESPQGAVIEAGGGARSSGTWAVGVTFRLGG